MSNGTQACIAKKAPLDRAKWRPESMLQRLGLDGVCRFGEEEGVTSNSWVPRSGWPARWPKQNSALLLEQTRSQSQAGWPLVPLQRKARWRKNELRHDREKTKNRRGHSQVHRAPHVEENCVGGKIAAQLGAGGGRPRKGRRLGEDTAAVDNTKERTRPKLNAGPPPQARWECTLASNRDSQPAALDA